MSFDVDAFERVVSSVVAFLGRAVAARANIVVSGAQAYDEDRWGDVQVGQAVLRGVKPCGRCQVTTTDQSTGEVRGPEPLETLGEYRNSGEFGVMFGVNYVTVASGAVRVGDAVATEDSA